MCLAACIYIGLSAYVLVCLHICLYVCLCMYLSVYLSVDLCICLSVCLSTFLYACLHIYLSVCLCVYLHICLLDCLSTNRPHIPVDFVYFSSTNVFLLLTFYRTIFSFSLSSCILDSLLLFFLIFQLFLIICFKI